MTTTDVRVFRDDPPLEIIFDIRRSVFVESQGVTESDEFDGRDATAIQFLALEEGESVGTARLREPDPGTGKVERVAVREAYRAEGWGRKILETVEATARQDSLVRLILHGQTAVEGFYQTLGYETTSDVYLEVGIPHVTMEKEL